MKIKLLSKWFIITIMICFSFTISAKKNERWTEKQAIEWSENNGWLRGSNYTPSSAVNQLEMWQADTFDPSTINRELGYAEGIGFNVMRVFLHHNAWLQDPVGFINRMNQYLTIASRHKIKTMFVFFDDCWNPINKIGKQPDPKTGIHNSGWLQDPGQEIETNTTLYPILEKYVKDIMNHFATDNRIVLWDLYNEPGGSKGDSSLHLLQQVFTWARETNANQPITSGVFDRKHIQIYNYQIANSDIITFHNYDPETLMKIAIDSLKAFNRPVLCSEYMARPRGSRFDNILPLLKKENVGAINWGFVKGKTNTIYAWDDKSHTDGTEPAVWFHDIFRPNGTPYLKSETDLIRKECLNTK